MNDKFLEAINGEHVTENANALIVRPRKNILTWTLENTTDNDFFKTDYNVFVPGRFIFGKFKEKNGQFYLGPNNEHRDFYKNSREDLQKYENNAIKGRLEIAKSLLIPEDILKSFDILNKKHIQKPDYRRQEEFLKIFFNSNTA